MAKVWLEERLSVLIPALAALSTDQEEEIARLCEEEIAAWRARPEITQPQSLRPVLTAARKALKERLKVTPGTRWKNPRTGAYEHMALRYLNFTSEEWDTLNALSEAKLEERRRNQRLIENPQEVVARAEKLLHSDRWDDLVVSLTLVTGRRLAELLKAGRFFPKSMYTVLFDGQLKRRDLTVKPYEIPILAPAELVLAAWHRLRSLEDTSSLEVEAVTQKYSRAASENANRLFTGLIPQRAERENLYTHSFRAVYARIAVLWFCPVQVVYKPYVSTILGHYFIRDEKEQRDALAGDHYDDYAIGDGNGQIDGRQGIRLSEPGVEVLEVFRPKKGGQMSTTDATKGQDQQQMLETKKYKTRGTLTVKPGTYDQGVRIIEERGFQGVWEHDRLLVDLISNDTIAHQMYALLAPLAEELHADGPVSTLQALIGAYRAGGSGPQAPALAELLREVSSEKEPIAYLKGLVERDRKFKEALTHRHEGVDYSSLSMEALSKIKTPEAAIERFKRAVDAIIAHNNKQQDPLHLWFVNAAATRDLVGGRNDAVMEYLETRRAEIDAHHKQYGLTPRQNSKPIKIEDQVIVEPGWKKLAGKPRGKKQDGEAEDE